MGRLEQRLRQQRSRGSRYFIASLSALDIHWACTAGMLRPLPEDPCAMGTLFRAVDTNTDPIVEKALAASPLLMEHRDFIYQTHLELPVDLKV